MSNAFEKAFEASAKLSIKMAAKMTGMKPETVAGIMAATLPKAMEAAAADPETAKAALTQSFEALPEPLQAMYAKMGEQAVAKGATADDFNKLFGASAAAMQTTAEEMAGDAKSQAGAVLGAGVPAMKDAMRAAAEEAGQTPAKIDPAVAQNVLRESAKTSAAILKKLAG